MSTITETAVLTIDWMDFMELPTDEALKVLRQVASGRTHVSFDNAPQGAQRAYIRHVQALKSGGNVNAFHEMQGDARFKLIDHTSYYRTLALMRPRVTSAKWADDEDPRG